MELDQARAVADNPIVFDRANLALALDVFRRAYDRAESVALDSERLRTLGGIPPVTR